MIADKPKVLVALPCYFDVPSTRKVHEEAQSALTRMAAFSAIEFVVVDDSAGRDPAISQLVATPGLTVIQAPYNLGHQDALVFGLRSLSSSVDASDFIVTMDSDGEDRPQDLPALIEPLLRNAEDLRKVCLARRTQRHEALPFKLSYQAYKFVFKAVTGTIVRTGNFAAYRGWFLRELISHPTFDRCYSSSFVSLPIDRTLVPLPRGRRYDGKSKMGFVKLVAHGLKMLTPFGEHAAVRAIFTSFIAGTALLAALAVEAWAGHIRASVALLAALIIDCVVLGTSTILFVIFSTSRASSMRRLYESSNRK